MTTYTDYADDTSGNTLYAKPEPLVASPWATDKVTGAETGSTGSYAFSLDSSLAYVVYRQAGGSAASTDLKIGRFSKADVAIVLPASGTSISRTVGTAIQAYVSELLPVTVTVVDSSGNNVNLSSLTLELVFECGSTETVITNGSITKANGYFTFTLTSTLTASERTWQWALRNTSNEAVILLGTLQVLNAPNN